MIIRNFLLLISLLAGLTSCNRQLSQDKSLIKIQVPSSGEIEKLISKSQMSLKSSKKVGSLAALPSSGFKICFGVNVTATDIANQENSCGSNLGAFKGFVGAGETLELFVPSGSGRKVELYAHLSTNTTGSCSTWTATCSAAQNCNMYKVAVTEGVELSGAETTVNMTVDFQGLASNAVSTESTSNICDGSLHAALTSAGDIVNSSLQSLGISFASPAIAAIYQNTSGTINGVTRSGLATESAGLLPKPQIRSVSVKPDTNEVFGVLVGGKLIKIDATGDYSEFTTASCPFATCDLPPWFRSISMGHGTNIFGLDYGGNIWKIDSAGTLSLQTTSVPAYIQQVVYH